MCCIVLYYVLLYISILNIYIKYFKNVCIYIYIYIIFKCIIYNKYVEYKYIFYMYK